MTLLSMWRAPTRHQTPVEQENEDCPALRGDGGMEGAAHRLNGGGMVEAIDGTAVGALSGPCTTGRM
jgi:hypothetical protein